MEQDFDLIKHISSQIESSDLKSCTFYPTRQDYSRYFKSYILPEKIRMLRQAAKMGIIKRHLKLNGKKHLIRIHKRFRIKLGYNDNAYKTQDGVDCFGICIHSVSERE